LAGSRQSLRVVPLEPFGSLLRRRRHNDDLTQAELGKKLGVSQQTIGAWEHGDRPQNRFLDVLAEYLSMDKQKLVLLIGDQMSMMSSQDQADTGVNESTGEATEESADSDDAMMRELAKSFIGAQRRGPLSPQDAEAYGTLFKYFGRNK
jgi:transcriptional regulator with XRE-family HTH domain